MIEGSEELAAMAALIHDLRKHKKVTLNELAERIGRSVGFVSQVERGLSRLTMADLTAISDALDVSTSYFYQPPKPKALEWVSRPAERRTMHLAGGITDVLISPVMNGAFTVLESSLAAGASSGERLMRDRSEQAGYVLEGELTLWLDDAEQGTTLQAGDAFQVPSYARLRYANQGTVAARVLWVYT